MVQPERTGFFDLASQQITMVVILATATAWSADAAAASFPCARAATLQEKLICADPALSKMDDELAAEYRRALPGFQEPRVRSRQIEWLRNERDKCTDALCLKSAYADRLRELRGGPIQAPVGITPPTNEVLPTAPRIPNPPPEASVSAAAPSITKGSVVISNESLTRERRPGATDLSTPNSAIAQPPDRSLCLEDICIGDDLGVLLTKQWVSRAEWRSVAEKLDKERKQVLGAALGKSNARRLFAAEEDRVSRTRNAGTPSERLSEIFQGRVLANPQVVKQLADVLQDGSLEPFDRELLELLAKVTAVCRSNPADAHKPKFVGVLKKDSPNKTAYLVELFQGPDGSQQWKVSAITRVFDVQWLDKPATAALYAQIREAYPSVRQVRGSTEFSTGPFFASTPTGMTRFGEVAAIFLRKSVEVPGNAFAQLVVLAAGYDGHSRWPASHRSAVPTACIQKRRVD